MRALVDRVETAHFATAAGLTSNKDSRKIFRHFRMFVGRRQVVVERTLKPICSANWGKELLRDGRSSQQTGKWRSSRSVRVPGRIQGPRHRPTHPTMTTTPKSFCSLQFGTTGKKLYKRHRQRLRLHTESVQAADYGTSRTIRDMVGS